MMNMSAVDFTTVESTWDWYKLSQYLSQDVLDSLIPINVPRRESGRDLVAWLRTSSGLFSVSSTYEVCSENWISGENNIFISIWKLKSPPWLRSFL